MSLVTVEQFNSFKSGDPQAYLDAASALVQRYCGWKISPRAEETFVLDGRGSRHLWLPTLMLVDVISVTNDGETVPIEDYVWSKDGYVELLKGCWSKRASGISITALHGYEATPADLAGVIMAAAVRGASSPTGAYLQRAGAVQMQWKASEGSPIGGDFLSSERSVLDLYKLPPRQ